MPLIGTEVCYNKSMSFKIERNDITRVRADAIVNTANPLPVIGKGTDTSLLSRQQSQLSLGLHDVVHLRLLGLCLGLDEGFDVLR